MYQLSNGSYVNANKITHFIEIDNAVNPDKKYLIILADGTKQYVNQEDFEALKEASGTVTYSDVIVTDKLSVGDIEDIEAEISKIRDYSDVKDVVGTYDDLLAYDTSTLNLNDVIEVLSDRTQDDANTMYKWDGTQFNLIGKLGPFYTKVEVDNKLANKVDKEAGKGLSTNDYTNVDKEYLTNLRATMPNVDDITINLTYAEIKALKDANKLIAGRTYRITDYSTMTIDPETRSAGNDFDIILKANTTNSFDPICSAHVKTGTNYFIQSYVSQWILWYNFDNDTNLCSWVDANCKGYIYRMIDEYNNDLAYDFKNIQFKRYKIASTTYNTYSNLIGMYLGNTSPYGYTIDSNDFVWRYTFVCSDALDEDLSNKHIEVGEYTTCRYVKQIKMGTRLSDSPYRSKLQLNNNVFISGNIMCDMTFGNQTHTNTVQVVNDFSYNYFGSMMRRNLIYVTDFNHNNIRECLEDNLIGSGTKMFSWNWLGDHCSSNIIQGMTLVYCLGYLRYVKADSPNETLSDVKLSTTFVGTENYSIWITNAIDDNTSDLSYDEIGTIAGLKLDHSKLSAATINYLGEVSITGRPIRVITSDMITNTDIYFDEATSAVYEWELKNSRGSSSNHLIIDFRDSTGALVTNAVKTYEKKIYSINETLTGWSGTFSYKVYDSTNKFEKTYMWSSVMDGLTPTANVILKDLTKHEVVNRVDSNYEIVDNILVNAIDKIDPSKNYTVTDHTDEATYQVTVPTNAKLLMLQSIGGNTVKLSPSVASDSTTAMVKTMPSTVYTFDGSKFYGDSKVASNLSLGTLNAQITPSGVLENSSQYKVLIIQATSGKTYYLQNNSVNQVVIAYYSSMPTINSTSIDGTRTVIENVTSFTATSSNYITVRFPISDANAMVVEYTGIHNLELSGLKVEGANKLPIPDVAETTYNGITYKAVGGKIYAKRTSAYANNVEIYFARDISLTGSFNLFSNYSNENLYYRTSETSYTSSINQTKTNITIDRLSLVFGAEFNQTSYIELTPMFVYGSVAPTTYQPYVAPTTKTIDLSTILYNGSPLFEGNSLKAVNDVKDILTPYKATKKLGYVDLGTLDYIYNPNNGFIFVDSAMAKNTVGMPNALISNNYTLVGSDSLSSASDKSYTIYRGHFYFKDSAYTDATTFKTAMSGVYLVYELETPIEVSIDWSSILRNIQGYPNGSIIAENTYNMDVESVITYNSIIQETLCDSVTITRNGVDILTRNLPTQTSDGWSAGTQRNYRVFCDYEGNDVLKRENNVNKSDMGTPTWNYNPTPQQFSTSVISDLKLGDWQVAGNILCKPYTTIAGTNLSSNDMCIALNDSTQNIFAKDSKYTDGATFKLANTNEPLYYELADASKTETDMDDFDYFFDVEEGDVITFNNPYAQQVYATYSFLIEREDN